MNNPIAKEMLNKDTMLQALKLTQASTRVGDIKDPSAQVVYQAIKEVLPNAKIRVAVVNGSLMVAGQTYELRAWLRQAGFRFDRDTTKAWHKSLEVK